MKRRMILLSLSFTITCATTALAVDENERPMRRPFGGLERPGSPERIGGPEKAGGPNRASGPERMGDPARMVAMLMKQFDQDGDQKLDASELEKLLVSMRDRRISEGMQRGGPQMRPDMRPGGFNRPGTGGRPDADGQTKPGGVVPRRPPMARDNEKTESPE